MSIQDKLRQSDLSAETKVNLIFEDGEDVIHAWDGYEDAVYESTGVAKQLAQLVTDPSFKDNDVLDEMRSYELLEDYPRDGSGFTDFVEEVIKETNSDYEWFEKWTENYDHKRGFMNVHAKVGTTVEQVLNASPDSVSGWKAEVTTDLGTTTVEC